MTTSVESQPFEFAQPRIMRIGGGALAHIADVVSSLGVRRPLLVTDRFLVTTGVADRVALLLTEAGLHPRVFADTVPDPTTESVSAAVDAALDHQADSVIGLGGGSPMDTAKAVALLASQGGVMAQYRAPLRNDGSALPIIAVPTTAGSGSEATQFTIITDGATDEKMLCTGPAFLPVAAIVDYELTVSMPARLTADTGIDALTHAVEAYVSRKANPFSDALCLSAITTIGTALRVAVADGTDREARSAMMRASTQAGIAFSNSSVALVHGMSRPIGGHFHVAHGLSNAMLFPTVTEFSIAGAVPRYADCARAFGAASLSDDDATAAAALVTALKDLCADLAVPTPQGYGIGRTAWDTLIPTMVAQAVASGSPSNNPRLPSDAEIGDIYSTIYS
ncbi:iron-containing alcohol dehydrogenase [soil metagenome]